MEALNPNDLAGVDHDDVPDFHDDGFDYKTPPKSQHTYHYPGETVTCPLSFGTVMEWQPLRESRSALLRLPYELLSEITRLLAGNEESLASLALVNSDCRQMARSCQFAEVRFNASKNSFGLLRVLMVESLMRQNATHGRRSLTIGACIRRFIMSTHRCWKDKPNETKERYRKNVLRVMAKAMPNLGYVDWRDEITGSSESFTSLFKSKAQHIVLPSLSIAEPYSLEPSVTPPAWPLRWLLMTITELNEHHLSPMTPISMTKEASLLPPRDASKFFVDFLQRCAPTLETLIWSYLVFFGQGMVSFGAERIAFPRLRTAVLLSLVSVDSTVFASLLDAPLRHLNLPIAFKRSANPDIIEALGNCATLLDLETLVIPDVSGLVYKGDEGAKTLESFLARHTHIKKLSISGPLEESHISEFYDTKLMPMLQTEFTNLRSLSISCVVKDESTQYKPRIRASSLKAIGRIQSLEQLCIKRDGDEADRFLINHDLARGYLSTLTELRKLAFTGDQFECDIRQAVERRAARILIDVNERIPGDDGDVSEELAIADCVAEVVEAYAEVLPKLDWALCGQFQMGIHRKPAIPKGVKAVPLVEVRESCFLLLRKTFEIPI